MFSNSNVSNNKINELLIENEKLKQELDNNITSKNLYQSSFWGANNASFHSKYNEEDENEFKIKINKLEIIIADLRKENNEIMK